MKTTFIAVSDFSIGTRRFKTGQPVSGCETSPALTAALLTAGRIEEAPAEQSPTHYQDSSDQLRPIRPGQTVQRAWSPPRPEGNSTTSGSFKPDRSAAVALLVAAFKRSAARRRGKRTARAAHAETPAALLVRAARAQRLSAGDRRR